jgi:hypothetical protein
MHRDGRSDSALSGAMLLSFTLRFEVSAAGEGLIPFLSQVLDMTPAALYERQRALVRIGLLDQRPGRGPGSGVPATSQSLATLLISIAATGSLSEVGEMTKLFANLKSETGRCPFTGKKTLAAALTAVLDSPLSKQAVYLDLERGYDEYLAILVIEKSPGRTYRDDELARLRAAGEKPLPRPVWENSKFRLPREKGRRQEHPSP